MDSIVERCTFCRRFVTLPGSFTMEADLTYPICDDCIAYGKDYYDSGIAVKKPQEDDDDIFR